MPILFEIKKPMQTQQNTIPPMFSLLHGDCLEKLATLRDSSIDAVVTDPPYGLGEAPDALAMLRDWLETGHHEVKSKRGFMGKTWDNFVPQPRVWHEVFRVLKPGGHVLAFAGTRTQDLMALGLRLAGFEIRDLVAWVYSSGFPKSHNMDNYRGKLTCDCSGHALPYAHEQEISREPEAEREMQGMRRCDVSSAKHTCEGRRKLLQQGLQEQSAPAKRPEESLGKNEGAKQSSMERRDNLQATEGELQRGSVCESAGMGEANGSERRLPHGTSSRYGENARVSFDEDGSGQPQRPQSIEQPPIESGVVSDERRPQARGSWPVCGRCGKPIVPEGFGTALKPALEPITLARKPLEGTVAANMLKWHTGAINVDGCRVEHASEADRASATPQGKVTAKSGALAGKTQHDGERSEFDRPDSSKGRWPANLIHDGSEDVVTVFPDSKGQLAPSRSDGAPMDNAIYGAMKHGTKSMIPRDDGDNKSAARFFYCAKVSPSERNAGLSDLPDKEWKADGAAIPQRADRPFKPSKNNHPTVKPIALMRYLCRLITPPSGTILDPYLGSGSTGVAALQEGFDFIGIEREEEYFAIASARIDNVSKP